MARPSQSPSVDTNTIKEQPMSSLLRKCNLLPTILLTLSLFALDGCMTPDEPDTDMESLGRGAASNIDEAPPGESALIGPPSPVVIKSGDYATLRYGTYSNGYLTWSGGGSSLSATYKYSAPAGAGVTGTKLCDPWNGYCGECVSFVKVLSGRTSATATWRPGLKVSSGSVPIGSAIATFPGGTYSGHTAFFAGYVYGGFEVFDENYSLNGLVKKHTISQTKAGNYSVVLAP